MNKPSKRNSIPRFLRQPNNGIAGYEEKTGEEQMKLFTGLIERGDGRAVRKL